MYARSGWESRNWMKQEKEARGPSNRFNALTFDIPLHAPFHVARHDWPSPSMFPNSLPKEAACSPTHHICVELSSINITLSCFLLFTNGRPSFEWHCKSTYQHNICFYLLTISMPSTLCIAERKKAVLPPQTLSRCSSQTSCHLLCMYYYNKTLRHIIILKESDLLSKELDWAVQSWTQLHQLIVHCSWLHRHIQVSSFSDRNVNNASQETSAFNDTNHMQHRNFRLTIAAKGSGTVHQHIRLCTVGVNKVYILSSMNNHLMIWLLI